MLTNIINYEPKTDWGNHCKIDMNIRDLQEKYMYGCNCCGKFYHKNEFSKLVNTHFKTKKHKNKCLDISNEKFISDFRDVTDINKDFEQKCKDLRHCKARIFDQMETIKELKDELSIYHTPICTNLIDI